MSKQLIVLITGANRGLGLALTQTYLSRGDRVVATCRHPAKAVELHRLKESCRDDLLVLRLDVNLGRSVIAAAEDIASHVPRLDALINNAGIAPGRELDTLEKLEMATLRDTFDTNALGALRTTRALLPLLRLGKTPRVVNVSSGAGSLSRRAGAGGRHAYAYAASKAALNMFTRIMADELKEQNICVAAITPGWVRTEMGGPEAEGDPAEAAAEMAAAIDGLTMEHPSQWFDRRGAVSEYAW